MRLTPELSKKSLFRTGNAILEKSVPAPFTCAFFFQGYYDPTKTKIVHLSMNPSSVARQQRGEELEKLKKENECLRRKLKLLEEGGSSSNDTSLLSKLSPETAPSVVRQVEG